MSNFSIARYLDSDGPLTIGQARLKPAVGQHGLSNISISSIATRDTRARESCKSPPASPSSITSSTVLSRTDTFSSTKSGATTITDATSLSTAPSDDQNENFDQVLLNMPTHALDLPCIFRDIMDCPHNEFGDFDDFDDWSEHIIDHFSPSRPPPHALCIFCERSFEDEDATECWNRYLEHIREHFQGGKNLNHRRPDFRVLKYLRDKERISEQDYELFCTGTERPTMAGNIPVPGLLPLDCESEEMRLKREAKERASNRIIVCDPRHGRERQRLTRRNKTLPTTVIHS